MASHAGSVHELLLLEIQTLKQFVEHFPEHGLSKILTGYLSSSSSKVSLIPDSPDLSDGGVALNPDETQQATPLSQQDVIELMTVRTPNWTACASTDDMIGGP
jgi:superkiller protein 3